LVILTKKVILIHWDLVKTVGLENSQNLQIILTPLQLVKTFVCIIMHLWIAIVVQKSCDLPIPIWLNKTFFILNSYSFLKQTIFCYFKLCWWICKREARTIYILEWWRELSKPWSWKGAFISWYHFIKSIIYLNEN
jgi:hypothetical protein